MMRTRKHIAEEQTIIISNNEIDVKEDALQLLGDYTWGPYKILEQNYGYIEDELKPDADYVINMHGITKTCTENKEKQ